MSSITRETVLQMDLKTIFAAVKDPSTSKEMQVLLKDRPVAAHVSKLMLEAQNREAEVDAQLTRVVPPSTEQLATEAQELAATAVVAPLVEEPPVPVAAKAYEVEDSALKAVGVTVVRDANGNPTRYIEEYQVMGEDGKPIGRPTHLESRTLAEHFGKQREVHTQATRAFHRLKQQKLSFKQQEKTILSPEAIAEAARIALEEKSASKVTDVIHATIETEYQKREREIKEKQEFENGREISNNFMRAHLHDYNPCVANQKTIGEYFVEHNLEFTLDNLEAAFVDLMDQNKLVKVATPVTERQVVEVANPTPTAAAATTATPVIPAAEPPAAVPASVTPAQPEVVVAPPVEATAPTPAAPNQQPAARRPGVNGSLPPGTLSAQRPGTPDPALARKEFLKMVKDMKPEVMKNKLKTDPQFVKQLESYGIRVR